MTNYMLDTDISSYIIKEKPIHVLERFRQLEMRQLHISVITYAELIYGVEYSSNKKINRPIIDDFIRHLSVLDWDKNAAEQYGHIRAFLRKEGLIIGSMDMMIAAHARSERMVLVTNNDKHFKRIPKLSIENWASKAA